MLRPQRTRAANKCGVEIREVAIELFTPYAQRQSRLCEHRRSHIRRYNSGDLLVRRSHIEHRRIEAGSDLDFPPQIGRTVWFGQMNQHVPPRYVEQLGRSARVVLDLQLESRLVEGGKAVRPLLSDESVRDAVGVGVSHHRAERDVALDVGRKCERGAESPLMLPYFVE